MAGFRPCADPAAGVHVHAVNAGAVDSGAVSFGREAVRFKHFDIPGHKGRRSQHDAAAHFERSVELGDLSSSSRRAWVEPIHTVHDDSDGEGAWADAGKDLVKLVGVDAQTVQGAGLGKLGVDFRCDFREKLPARQT